ncbi:MAG: hypothetical protein AAGH79_14370, partial [Bacteroidota bacterium]
TNEHKKPAIGAQVLLGDRITQTNEFGFFHFPQATLNLKGTTIQVHKEGYFPASRTFFPLPDSDQRIQIQLVPMVFNHSFNAGLGATVITNGGASVSFPANAIMDEETGVLYQGEVQVATHWLDPTDPSTIDQMPGSLHGLTPDLEPGALATYGMIAVELRSPEGDPLNLHRDAKATLHMPVTDALKTDAPTTIPLWYYHEDLGIWVEEGMATLADGTYQGEVSHFSWWNCDLFMETAYITFRLLDPTGQPLNQMTAFLTLSSGAVSSASTTDADGFYNAPVPANEVFNLQLVTSCGEIVFQQDLGPISGNTNLGTIILDNQIGTTYEANGLVMDCNNQALESGYYILVEHPNGILDYQYSTEAAFSIYEWACGGISSITVQFFDLENGQISQSYNINHNQANDLGVVALCEETLPSVLTVSVNGTTHIYEDFTVLFYEDSTRINTTYEGNPPTNYKYFSAVVGGASVGDFSGNNRHYALINHDLNWVFWEYYQLQPQQYNSFILDEYGDQPGDIVSGTFSGLLYNQAAGQLEEVMGTFYYEVP